MYNLGPLNKVLAYIKGGSSCEVTFSSSTHLPIPATTRVLLDHIEIDPANLEILIFCKVTDDNWMINNMIKWKGYTVIAVTDLSDSPNVGTWSFRGTGKMSFLEKNVSMA